MVQKRIAIHGAQVARAVKALEGLSGVVAATMEPDGSVLVIQGDRLDDSALFKAVQDSGCFVDGVSPAGPA